MKKIMSRRELLRWMALATAASLAACQSSETSTVDLDPARTGNPAESTTQPAVQPTQPVEGQAAEVATSVPQQASTSPSSDQAYLAVARGEDPAAITEAALKSLGGMERFVKNGYDVIIKPNICTDTYPFEYAATTNPVVVATLVRLAFGAGAKRVRVMDFPFGGTAESAYARSGIADAVGKLAGRWN